MMPIPLMVAALWITGAVGFQYTYLSVRYTLGLDGFYDIPLTRDAAAKDYVKMSHDEQLNVDLYSYPDDPRISILYDTYGNIGGLRISYIKADVGKRAASHNAQFNYTYDDKPMYTSGTYWGTDVWHTSVLFVSPDKLIAGGRANTQGQVAEDFYMKLDGVWTNISKDECKVEKQGFTKQACFFGMGEHYFYKVTPTMDCNDHQGAFLLYEKGELIGLGLNPFGSFTKKDRNWFEDPPADIVAKIVPNGPPCMKDWIELYGATSFHIFFKHYPRLTFCMWPWQKKDQCPGQ